MSEDVACDPRIEGSQTVRMFGDVPRWNVPGGSHREPRKGGHALPCSPIRGRQVGQEGMSDGGEGRGEWCGAAQEERLIEDCSVSHSENSGFSAQRATKPSVGGSWEGDGI